VAVSGWRAILFTNNPAGNPVGRFDALLRRNGHRLVAVVTTPGPSRRRSDGYLAIVNQVPSGIDVIVSNHPQRWAPMLAPLEPDLIMSRGFPWKLPDELLALPRLGVLNNHPSFLPRYRGPNPVGWALRNGDAELGISVHRMDASFDTGAILAQGSIPIADDDDIESIGPQIPALQEILWQQVLDRLARGEHGEPQDERAASEAPWFEDAWRTIDWHRPARDIHNQVRSWTGDRGVARGAFGAIDGQTVRIIKTQLLGTSVASGATPGQTIDAAHGELLVQCGDAPLRILTFEPVVSP
jgi:methionyl-tRNA formyltransferase